MKTLQGTKFYDRTDLDIETDVDVHSRNLTYNGFARIGVGFTNWRHALLLGSGDADASTL